MQRIKKKPSYFLAGLICITFLFSACTGSQRRFHKDPFNLQTGKLAQYPVKDAKSVFAHIQLKNQNVNTIKGIGTFHFAYLKDRFSSRLAWIAGKDGKIRLEMMGPHGRPTASLAANTSMLYFYSHIEKKFYKKRITDGALTSYLKIPITIHEMVDLLSGRIPVNGYDQIALTEDATGDGFILYMLCNEENQLVKLYLDSEKKNTYRAEFFNLRYKLSFRVELTNQKTIDAYKIPFQINIVDGKGANFMLEMDRVWANTDVKESIFTLTRPD